MLSKRSPLIATVMATLLALTLLVAFCASGTQGRRRVVRALHPTLTAGVRSSSSDDTESKDSGPLDNSQQSESESETPSSALSGGVEEEHAKVLPLAPLSMVRHHNDEDIEAGRVDHSYEAWFYSVTHPPLTPPPNFS